MFNTNLSQKMESLFIALNFYSLPILVIPKTDNGLYTFPTSYIKDSTYFLTIKDVQEYNPHHKDLFL